MPYTINGDWEKIVEGNRKFSVSCFADFDTRLNYSKIADLSIESSAVSNSTITFGSTCSDCLKITFRNYKSAITIRENMPLLIRLSVVGETDEEYAECDVGVFYIDSIKKTETFDGAFNIEVTAYDGFYKTEKKYIPSVTTPASIKDIINDIATQCDLKNQWLDTLVDDTWNDSIIIDNIKADLTCRQQIGYLAGLQGCFAKFNGSGQLSAKWYSETDKVITIDEQFLAEMTQEMETDVVVKMIETGTSDNTITKPTSTSGYAIQFENPYITDEIAENIYSDKVSEDKITFRPLSVHWRGNPKIVVGDIVKVRDNKDNELTCYIMQKTLSFDGGLSETYKCYGESTSSVTFNKSPSDVKFERVYSRMEEAVKSATNAVKQTEGSTFELIPDDEDESKNIGYRLYYEDSSDSDFNDCVIMATAGGIGFSTNGGDSFDAAAMYFAKDDDGEVHGYINGEFIAANSITADKIDASQLIITSSNVKNLDTVLNDISDDVSEANSAAKEASQQATTADTLARNAYASAYSANSAIGEWCYNNDTTYIDGGKIYTGTIQADSIASNTITTDKLSAGTVTLIGQWNNNDFSSNSIDNATAWEGIYTSFERETSCLRAQYTAANKNMLSDDISDFKMSRIYGWEVNDNTTITPHYTGSNIHYATLTATNTGRILIKTSTTLTFEKDKMYSIAAKFNGAYWKDNGNAPFAGYYLYDGDDHYKYNGTTQNIYPNLKNQEVIIEWTFKASQITEETAKIGIWFWAAENSSINLDWIAVYQANNEMTKGFRCSYSDWLIDEFKKTNLLVFQDTPDLYITSRQGQNDDIQRMTRKHTLKNGKRYAIVARLFPVIDALSGKVTASINRKSLTFDQQAETPQFSAKTSISTFKFVFDYSDEDGICDVGISWENLINTEQDKKHADIEVYWIQLYQDDVDEVGFYCSNAAWIKSEYQQTNIIEDVPLYTDYSVVRSAFQVYNDTLYFRGEVTSPYGNVGGLDYSPDLISISCDTAYFENIENIMADTARTVYNSSCRFIKSQQIVSLDDIESVYSVDLQKGVSVSQIFNLQSTDGEFYVATINAGGIKVVADMANAYSKLSYDGITTSGKTTTQSLEVSGKTITQSLEVSGKATFAEIENIQTGLEKSVSGTRQVYFSKSFDGVPNIIVTPYQRYAPDGHYIIANVTNVTNEYFEVAVKDTGGSYGSDIMWIATNI